MEGKGGMLGRCVAVVGVGRVGGGKCVACCWKVCMYGRFCVVVGGRWKECVCRQAGVSQARVCWHVACGKCGSYVCVCKGHGGEGTECRTRRHRRRRRVCGGRVAAMGGGMGCGRWEWEVGCNGRMAEKEDHFPHPPAAKQAGVSPTAHAPAQAARSVAAGACQVLGRILRRTRPSISAHPPAPRAT